MKTQDSAKNIVKRLLFAAVNLITIIITALFLFDEKFYVSVLFLSVSSVLFVALSSIKDLRSIYCKIFISLSTLLLVIVSVYDISVKVDFIKTLNSLTAIKNLILKSGKWGVVVFFLLTILQVVVLPIPASVTILLGSLIYGPIISFVVSSLGTFLASIICYVIGYFFGFGFVSWMMGEKKTKKAMVCLQGRAKIPFVLMMIFPFFPDDIICMVAGLIRMSFKFYVVAILICRSISIALICFFGTGNLIPFSGWGIPVWITLFAIALVGSYLIGRIIKKRNKKSHS